MVMFYIATDKVLVDNKKEIEILQERIVALNLQLLEREEMISLSMENMEGIRRSYFL